MTLMDYLPQIERIRTKLERVRITKQGRTAIDAQRYGFAYKAHQFQLNPPLSLEGIQDFEQRAKIKLPSAYVAFLHFLGNGGAGIGYGIYPLGTHLDTYIDQAFKHLAQAPKLHPELTQAVWDKEVRDYIFVEDLADQDYVTQDEVHDKRLAEYYSGLITVATEGCGSCFALIVAGDYYGRVIHASYDYSCPTFMDELDFLVWYEAWLDSYFII